MEKALCRNIDVSRGFRHRKRWFLDTGLCLDGCRVVSKIQQKMNNTGLFSRIYMFSQCIF